MRDVRRAHLVQTAGYVCFGAPVTWPAASTLGVAAGLAVTGLVIAEYAMATLAHRARPADDQTQARLDDALRGMSARAITGAAAALGLSLTAATFVAISELSSANVCVPGAAGPVPQYPWLHACLHHPWAGIAGVLFLIAAVVTVVKCRRRQDPRLVGRKQPRPGSA